MHLASPRAIAFAPVEAATLPWTLAGAPRLTIVVKVTFRLRHGGTAVLVAPEPIEHEDDHVDDDLERSLRAASDLAPFLPMGGVVLTGHALAPGGRPVGSLAVRLALVADATLVDKTILVLGDRAAEGLEPAPFTSMPLVYERARGGPLVADNPIGLGPASDRRPNLVHPSEPERPACFGPIPQSWPRRRELAAGHRASVPGEPLALSSELDFRALHPAPNDQWTPYLRGDEWLVLEHLTAERARLETRLPSVRALARFRASADTPLMPVPLVADTLLVDADRERASLLFRGHVALEPSSRLGDCVFHTTLERPGLEPEWAEPTRALSAPRLEPFADARAPHEADDPLLSTQLDEPTPSAKAPALPFRAPLEVPRAPTFGAPPPSSPRAAAPPSSPHAPASLRDVHLEPEHDEEASEHDETGQMLRPALPILPFGAPPRSTLDAPLPPPPPWLEGDPPSPTLELEPRAHDPERPRRG